MDCSRRLFKLTHLLSQSLGPENNLLFGEFSYGSARLSDDDVLVLGAGDGSKNSTEREGAKTDSDGDESDATA